jgi:cytochrome c biogenesis factor
VGTGRRTSILTAAALGALSAIAALVACAPAVDVPRAMLAAAAGAGAATATLGVARASRRGSAVGGHLAHAALGLAVLGIAGTATGGSRVVSLQAGESATVLGHEVAYDGVTVVDGPVDGSSAVVADVTTGGQRLQPSLVAFPHRGVLLAETSLRSTPAVDVQVSLRTARDDGTALLEIGVHPLQVLVWWGAVAVVAAGAFAAWEASRRPQARPGRHERSTAAVTEPG